MAARLEPGSVQATRQSLHHLVAKVPWRDETLLEHVRKQVLPAMRKHGPVVAWIVDDTGFPKKGTHSVGVARQYCGQVGKQDNCRVAVSLSVATWNASLPVGYRLYLPKEWAGDAERREETEVPKEVRFQTKPEIALDQIRAALAFDFRLREGLGVNPHMERRPVLHGQLELVGIAALNLFHPGQLDTGALGRVIDQGTIEVALHGGGLHFIRGLRLNHTPAQERPQLPTVGAVENLDRRLAVKLQLEPHFAGARQFHQNGQLNLLDRPVGNRKGPLGEGSGLAVADAGGARNWNLESSALIPPGAQFSGQRHGLDGPPALQSASGRDVFCRRSRQRKAWRPLK
jgi:hypothetical protein